MLPGHLFSGVQSAGFHCLIVFSRVDSEVSALDVIAGYRIKGVVNKVCETPDVSVAGRKITALGAARSHMTRCSTFTAQHPSQIID